MKSFSLILFLALSFAFAPSYSLLEQEKQAFEATNTYRAKKNRDPLELDTFLCRLAREHSERMASGKTRFGHDGFDKRVKKIEKNLGTGSVAENVFMASYEADGNEAVEEWIDSPGHRKNLLNKSYKRVGLGMASGKNGTFYTQIFCDE
ncbi:MAG TPA: CAP domain-containing protein [Bacteroidetes bacterium]|nr:CAP domain-containing protein [Bacteroidota bacterium]